jgi:5-enolpyruvylshikimate-3-phosphate synthase
LDATSEALGIEDLEAHFLQLRRSIGPPWGKDHRIAMAAAIVAAGAR